MAAQAREDRVSRMETRGRKAGILEADLTDLNPFLPGNRQGFGLPDELRVIGYGTIGGELRAAGDVADGHGCPATAVQEGMLRAGLRVDVAAEVGERKVQVALLERIDHRGKRAEIGRSHV